MKKRTAIVALALAAGLGLLTGCAGKTITGHPTTTSIQPTHVQRDHAPVIHPTGEIPAPPMVPTGPLMVQWSETPVLCERIVPVKLPPNPGHDLATAWNLVERSPNEMLADVQNSGIEVDNELSEARLAVLYAAQQLIRGDLRNPTMDIKERKDTWMEMVNHTRAELTEGEPLPETEGTPVDELLKHSVELARARCDL
jgi:hypothetical protein